MERKTMNKVEVLKAALKEGFVKFSYYRTDGTLRIAIGTKNMPFIEEIKAMPSKDDKRDANPNLCTYYDLARSAWRCFRKELFNEIIYEEMSPNEACVNAIAIAMNDTEYDIEKVMQMSFAIIGTKATQDILSYVCSHIGENDVVDGCMETIYGTTHERVIGRKSDEPTPTAVTEPIATPTHTPTTQMSTKKREELIEELVVLRRRESEILSILLLS